jgi:hypothetical protein
MVKDKFEIKDEFGRYVRLEPLHEDKFHQSGEVVDLTVKSTSEEENYFIEHIELTKPQVLDLIRALQEIVGTK